MAVCRKPVHSHHQVGKRWVFFFIKAHSFGFLHLNLGCRDAHIQIQSLHSCTTPNVQWCNCRAHLHCLWETGDLSAWCAASPKLYTGCCGGDRSLDIIISLFLSPGHPGSLFVHFISPVTEIPSWVQRGSKIKNKTSASASSFEDRNHPSTCQTRQVMWRH